MCDCIKGIPETSEERGEFHHKTCPKYSTERIPRLFYWEDAEDTWCPWVEDYDFSAMLDLIDDDEETELRFKRVLMTDKEMDELSEI